MSVLASAGHAHEQAVAAGEEARPARCSIDLVLADHDLRHLLDHRACACLRLATASPWLANFLPASTLRSIVDFCEVNLNPTPAMVKPVPWSRRSCDSARPSCSSGAPGEGNTVHTPSWRSTVACFFAKVSWRIAQAGSEPITTTRVPSSCSTGPSPFSIVSLSGMEKSSTG